MPQTQNMKTSDTPYGRGSLHNALLESTFRTRRRAAQINRGEVTRMRLANKMLQKHEKADQERKARVINGIQKRIEELHAYQNVLTSFNSNKLKTLQWGFKPGVLATEKSFHRYQLETKIYHCGFTIGTLYPEIKQAIQDGKPEKVREQNRHKLLETAKRRSDFMINRRWTNEGMKRDRVRKFNAGNSLDQQDSMFLTNEKTNLEKIAE